MTGSAHFPDRNTDQGAVLVVHKDKNLTTKTPRAPRNTKLTSCFFLVKLSALGVLVVKHLKLTDD